MWHLPSSGVILLTMDKFPTETFENHASVKYVVHNKAIMHLDTIAVQCK